MNKVHELSSYKIVAEKGYNNITLKDRCKVPAGYVMLLVTGDVYLTVNASRRLDYFDYVHDSANLAYKRFSDGSVNFVVNADYALNVGTQQFTQTIAKPDVYTFRARLSGLMDYNETYFIIYPSKFNLKRINQTIYYV